MARPTNPEAGRFGLKASADQLRRWEAAAKAHGQELSSWVRSTLDKAARRTERARGTLNGCPPFRSKPDAKP